MSSPHVASQAANSRASDALQASASATVIPAGWQPIRMKFVAVVNPPASEVRSLPPDTEVSFVPMEAVGEYGGLDLRDVKSLAEVGSGYTYFADGDVVVAKITPCFENGKGALASGLTNGIAFGTTELHVLRPRRELDPRFVFYVTVTHAFRKLGESEMYGAGGQKRVPPSYIQNLHQPIPPLADQRAIAAYLDRKTSRIDELVRKKERLIELLQEKRTALITRAVTRGLDPNVPMKDSGVEWLGEIPAHWHLRRLKHVCDRVFVGIAEAATFAYVDDGVPMLRSTDVRGNRIRTDDIKRIERGFAVRLATKRLKVGDIVTVRTGNAGVSAVVPIEFDGGQCFTLVVSRLGAGHDSRYFCYWLNAPSGQRQFEVEGMGTAQINISVPIVQNAVVCVPPEREQVHVANFLETELARQDALVFKIQEAIERLKELRIALISAAVTGKLDMRDTAA